MKTHNNNFLTKNLLVGIARSLIGGFYFNIDEFHYFNIDELHRLYVFCMIFQTSDFLLVFTVDKQMNRWIVVINMVLKSK